MESRGGKPEAVVNGVIGLLAIAAAGLLVVLLSEPSDRYERSASDHSDKYAHDAERQKATRCRIGSLSDRADCVNEANQSARANQRAEQELAAQQVAAWWTKVTGGVAVFGVVLSAFGVFLVWRTFRATREANEIAREVGEAQAMAYVSVIPVECSILPDRIQVKYRLRNTGNSPAKAINVTIRAAVVVYSEIVALEVPQGKADENTELLFGHELAAGEDVIETHMVSQEIVDAANAPKPGPLWGIDLIATLSYKHVFNRRVEETQDWAAMAGAGLNPVPLRRVPFHTVRLKGLAGDMA